MAHTLRCPRLVDVHKPIVSDLNERCFARVAVINTQTHGCVIRTPKNFIYINDTNWSLQIINYFHHINLKHIC